MDNLKILEILSNILELAQLVDDSGGIGKIWIGPSLYIGELLERHMEKLLLIQLYALKHDYILVSFNPEDVQKILEGSLQKDSSYRFLQDWLGNGLFVAPGTLEL